MKNKHKLFLIIIISLFALSFSAYQYISIFQGGIAAAYQATKPANGHSWVEMQCTNDICVDVTSHKVGIGTDVPSEALEVIGKIKVSSDISTSGAFSATGSISTSGTVTATGDVCGAGACLSQIASFVANQPLVNNVHSQGACTTAGGTVVPSDVSYPQCRFDSAFCPSGWTQYKSYSTTVGVTGGGTTTCWNGCTSTPPNYSHVCSEGTLTTGSHAFSSAPIESATQLRGGPSGCGSCCTSSETWYSVRTQIGCY